MLLSFLTVDDSTSIIVTIVITVVATALCIFLAYRTRKERIKYKQDYSHFIEGLKTKSEMENDITYFINKHRRNGQFTLMYVDIDSFVAVNEAFGNEKGDEVLTKIAYNIQDALPPTARMTRYNGDEFLIFIKHETAINKINQLANKIISAISKPIKVYEETSTTVTGCIGIAFFPYHGNNLKKLMTNLDMALYIAKRTGRGSFAIYSEEMSQKESENIAYFHQIKAAIKNEQFCLYYQPIVDIERNEIIALEGLIRWNHPTKGVLSPAEFINIMEQSGDIYWVGIWGFEELIKQYFNLKRQFPYKKILLSMNLSPKQLMNDQIIPDFLKLIKKYRVDPSSFCFEIVEFAMFDKQPTITLNISRLQSLGFLIAIDGYGLEYDALSHLKDLPVDMIKLEKSFSAAAKDNYMMEKISEMLVGFAGMFNKMIIAEGIEDEAMLNQARKLTIKYAQGYHFSAPLSSEDILSYIANYSQNNTK